MKNELIVCENVSKKFSQSLRRSMFYGCLDIAQTIVGCHPKTERLRRDEFWAVDDVSVKLRKGEILGVIGPNGSGKTTFLRMLNGIFLPDKGRITIRGKVGALIQVGAGFHPMLSGRENIYINGSILGMTKKEIDRKFDAIVAFADIEKFLDAPVKHYSSGMYVRLGFSIAVHCQPDILLIDEVLAVGDSAFRQRCYQKMNEIKRNGVSIVLVTHDLLTVSKFCTTGLFLYQGQIKTYGRAQQAISDYQKLVHQFLDEKKASDRLLPGMPKCTDDISIKAVKYLNQNHQEVHDFETAQPLGFRIEIETHQFVANPIVQISLVNRDGAHIAVFANHIDDLKLDVPLGWSAIECWLERNPLLLNTYYITVAFYDETHSKHLAYWNGMLVNHYFRVSPNRISERMVEYTPICDFPKQWTIRDK